MSELSKSHFTIGEFAQLFGISKQTLFYYEKNEIFSPCRIEENGYRYYSTEQYFLFEIIITLRKLGVSLKEIKHYISFRNADNLRQLLLDKALECELQIELLQRNCNNLRTNAARLARAKKIKRNQITLEYCEAEYFAADPLSTGQRSMKELIEQIARHNLPFAKSEIFNEYFMGYYITPDELCSAEDPAISQVITRISHPDEYPKALCKPEGLYATIIAPDSYHTKYRDALQALRDFIHHNGLQIVGAAYIIQLNNYWSTAEHKEYVTEISIQVENPA